MVVDRDQPDSLTLRYTPTPIQSSIFDLYRFRISDENNTTKERLVDDTDTKVTFTGLTPGKLYNVTVWTVSDNVESRPLLRQDRLCEYFALTKNDSQHDSRLDSIYVHTYTVVRKSLPAFCFTNMKNLIRNIRHIKQNLISQISVK